MMVNISDAHVCLHRYGYILIGPSIPALEERVSTDMDCTVVGVLRPTRVEIHAGSNVERGVVLDHLVLHKERGPVLIFDRRAFGVARSRALCPRIDVVDAIEFAVGFTSVA